MLLWYSHTDTCTKILVNACKYTSMYTQRIVGVLIFTYIYINIICIQYTYTQMHIHNNTHWFTLIQHIMKVFFNHTICLHCTDMHIHTHVHALIWNIVVKHSLTYSYLSTFIIVIISSITIIDNNYKLLTVYNTCIEQILQLFFMAHTYTIYSHVHGTTLSDAHTKSPCHHQSSCIYWLVHCKPSCCVQ